MTDDPEERIFYRVARHLGKFAWEVKEQMPTSELLGWVAEITKSWTEPDLTHHHLAQIAHQIYLLRCSLPFTGMKPKAKFESFLNLFKEQKKKAEVPNTVGKPLKRTARGKLIDPEWQARIDAVESGVMAMLASVGQKPQVEEVTVEKKKREPKDKTDNRTHRSK